MWLGAQTNIMLPKDCNSKGGEMLCKLVTDEESLAEKQRKQAEADQTMILV